MNLLLLQFRTIQLVTEFSSLSGILIRYFNTVGNHETDFNFVPYANRYNTSFFEDYSNGGDYFYSVDYAGAHLIALSSETEYTEKGPQWTWLAKDLSLVDRSKTPWVIAYWHRPVFPFYWLKPILFDLIFPLSQWYNSNKDHHLSGEVMRKSMEDLLYDAHVDVVFAGHVHAYERCHRVYNYKPDPKAPMCKGHFIFKP